MRVRTGLEIFLEDYEKKLWQCQFAVLCNQASITNTGKHILKALSGRPGLRAVFGPQHGLGGHTQDNMIEWEGTSKGSVPIFSLYGKNRKPSPAMLAGIDTVVIDLQDVGARYYTFTWTMALMMEACAEQDIRVIVLDRPNPIGGIEIEGPLQDHEYLSFVGLHPLPIRHGKTIGELAIHLQQTCYPACNLTVVPCSGWDRDTLWRDTGLLWVPPSPNMPTPDTALVYPGACLLEGTTISEGRGTTRPFEQFGAPWMNGERLAEDLEKSPLNGAIFRPVEFEPTFHKHAGQICHGVFIHVDNPRTFRPVATYVEVIRLAYQQYLEAGSPTGVFAPASTPGAWISETRTGLDGFWKRPPYEYELEKMPIDILWGSPDLRDRIEGT